jgi:aspartate-semialdehyde dehydrogenase
MINDDAVIVVAGGTGLIGGELVALIQEKGLQYEELRLLGSSDSVGEVYDLNGSDIEVEALAEEAFDNADVVFFSTSHSITEQYLNIALERSKVIIDFSGVRGDSSKGILALAGSTPLPTISTRSKSALHLRSPAAAVVIMQPSLRILDNLGGIERISITTFHSVSSAGKHAVDELWAQGLAIYNQRHIETSCFEHQVAFNCVPQVDVLCDSGDTREEIRIIEEIRELFGRPDLPIGVTAVRVPVFHCFAASVSVELRKPVKPEQALEAFEQDKMIRVSHNDSEFPTHLSVAESDHIHLGRIRPCQAFTNGISFWVAADNVRRGAALNALSLLGEVFPSAQ